MEWLLPYFAAGVITASAGGWPRTLGEALGCAAIIICWPIFLLAVVFKQI